MSEEEDSGGSVIIGVILAFANLFVSCAILISLLQGRGAGIALLGFGLVQIPGVIGLGIVNSENRATLQGLIITSSIFFLLNAACWGVMMRAKF